jgi:2-amino-4-hydroxy-6-hydroxymethyldihydropteridine diphosphokinase
MEGFAEILGFSKLYRSKPYGFADQPSFVNAAARIRTTLSPKELLTKLQETERALGKKVIRENGPRVIDLDPLLYEDLVLDTNELQLPHPGILERDFVLRPLLDLNPELTHPNWSGTSIKQALEGIETSFLLEETDEPMDRPDGSQD